jgi:hypothetical protein
VIWWDDDDILGLVGQGLGEDHCLVQVAVDGCLRFALMKGLQTPEDDPGTSCL